MAGKRTEKGMLQLVDKYRTDVDVLQNMVAELSSKLEASRQHVVT